MVCLCDYSFQPTLFLFHTKVYTGKLLSLLLTSSPMVSHRGPLVYPSGYVSDFEGLNFGSFI